MTKKELEIKVKALQRQLLLDEQIRNKAIDDCLNILDIYQNGTSINKLRIEMKKLKEVKD